MELETDESLEDFAACVCDCSEREDWFVFVFERNESAVEFNLLYYENRCFRVAFS